MDDCEYEIQAAAARSLAELRRDNIDLGMCNYFRGEGDHICSATGGLCAVVCEPLCQTERPRWGWPSEGLRFGPEQGRVGACEQERDGYVVWRTMLTPLALVEIASSPKAPKHLYVELCDGCGFYHARMSREDR